MQRSLTYRGLWTLCAALAVMLAFSHVLDRAGEAQGAEALKRALVTFAVSRALNGAISVMQGTEVALEPAGVGVILSVGQLLDPINDLVERFSTVMLVASSSLGAQNLLLRITSTPGFDIALLAVAALLVLLLWWPRARGLAPLFQRLFLLMLFVRFAFPVVIIATGFVFDRFLEQEQAAALAELEATQIEIEELNEDPPPEAESPSLMDRFSLMLDETIDTLDVRDRVARLQERVANASEHIVNLIVIFVVQTVLLPIAFFWLFVEVLKTAARRLALRDQT